MVTDAGAEVGSAREAADRPGGAPAGEHAAMLRQQTALARFGEAALRSENLDEILREACRLVAEALGSEFAKVLELQRDGRTLLVKAGVGWRAGIVGEVTVAAEEGSSEGHALRTDEPVISNDIHAEARFSVPGFLFDHGVRSLANVVIIGGKGRPPYGVLQADSRAGRAFGEHDVSFLRTYANLLAAAVDRLRVLDETRAREAFARGVLAASPDWVTVMDADGTVRFMNEQGVRLAEAGGPGQGVGRPFAASWAARDEAGIRAAITRAGQSEVGRGEVVRIEGALQGALRDAAGAPRWWEISFAPLARADGRPLQLVGVARDVSERHRAEADRRENETRLGAALAVARLGLFDWNPNDGTVGLDDRGRDMFGFGPGEGTRDEEVFARIHPNDRERVRAAAYAAVAALGQFDAEYRVVRAGGEVRTVMSTCEPVTGVSGQAGWFVGVFKDVTERRQAEDRLRELNESLERAVAERTGERDRIWSSTSDLMAVAGLDGYLKSVNPAWERMLGWSEAELLAWPFVGLIDAADHAELDQVLRRLAAGDTVSDFIDHVIRKDGGRRTVMWDAVPSGGLLHIVGRDITELRRLEEQLRQSQKMEAVGQLTGGLAHDFNNLLTGITGSLELLQARVAQGRLGALDRYVTMAQEAAQRAAALTHRLLAFSRRQTLEPKPTDVNRLVGAMEELIRRTMGPAITVEVAAAAGLWPALVDPNQLENALLNLCLNARDAMPGGGTLVVETANKRVDARTGRAFGVAPGEYLTLCVSDDGTGMPADVAARAFDPFFTTKPLGEGTGLGLSMIYGFARQSGGQARIYSEMGGGTAVWLYLPRHHGEADAAEALPDLAHAPRAAGGETVLVVDDEPTVRTLVSEVLTELGYAAVEAADGAAGLRVLRSDARIDLLITDVGLPGGMNGRQVAEAGRALRPELRVLFITGYAETAVLSHGHVAPETQVLTKPFALEALAGRIRAMTGGF